MNLFVPNTDEMVAYGVVYKIRGSHYTVLDDWGGKVGENAAALMPDDSPDNINRLWTLIKSERGFRIKSVGHGTVLDDWGGKVGENAAALMPDDSPDNINRLWDLDLQMEQPEVNISSLDFGDSLTNLLQSGGDIDYALSTQITVKDPSLKPEVKFSESKEFTQTFTWGLTQKLGLSHTTKVNVGLKLGPVNAGVEGSLTISGELGANQNWTTTKKVIFSSEVKASPDKAGVYRIGKIVKSYSSAFLPFTAKLTLSALNPSTKVKYSGAVIASHFKKMGRSVIETDQYSATTSIEGYLHASFAVSSEDVFEKIRDIS